MRAASTTCTYAPREPRLRSEEGSRISTRNLMTGSAPGRLRSEEGSRISTRNLMTRISAWLVPAPHPRALTMHEAMTSARDRSNTAIPMITRANSKDRIICQAHRMLRCRCGMRNHPSRVAGPVGSQWGSVGLLVLYGYTTTRTRYRANARSSLPEGMWTSEERRLQSNPIIDEIRIHATNC